MDKEYEEPLFRDSITPDGTWITIIDSSLADSSRYRYYPMYYSFGSTSPYQDVAANCFDDILFDGQTTSIELLLDTYQFSGNETSRPQCRVRLESLSTDYYHYTTSLGLYNSTNGNPFAQPVQVYSNVTGGHGIVAGRSLSAAFIVFIPEV